MGPPTAPLFQSLQARLILARATLALLILPLASLALLILSIILLSIIFLSPRSARPFFYIQKPPINRRAADVMASSPPRSWTMFQRSPQEDSVE